MGRRTALKAPMVADPMVRSISRKRDLCSGVTKQLRPLLTWLLSGPLRLQIDQQMFAKFSTLKTVFYGQYHFYTKAIENIEFEGWLKYNARHSQPMGPKAPLKENVLATRSLDCRKIHLS